MQRGDDDLKPYHEGRYRFLPDDMIITYPNFEAYAGEDYDMYYYPQKTGYPIVD